MKSGGFKVIFDRTYPSKGHQMNSDLRFWIDEMNAEDLPFGSLHGINLKSKTYAGEFDGCLSARLV
jgi:hypothetical protein